MSALVLSAPGIGEFMPFFLILSCFPSSVLISDVANWPFHDGICSILVLYGSLFCHKAALACSEDDA